VGSYAGVLRVEVLGGAGVTYFDEGTGKDEPFPAGILKAVAPSVTGEVGVTPLTNAAAAQLAGAAITADSVNAANTKIASQFGLTNILAAPVLLGAGDSIASSDGDAGLYALVLAGMAKDAHKSGFSLVDSVVALAEDLQDSILNGKNGATNVANALTIEGIKEQFNKAVTDYAKEEAKSGFSSQLAQLDIKVDTPVISTGPVLTDIEQAKKLFTDLRAGILPYANDEKKGFLDGEAEKLETELNALTGNTVDGLEVLVGLSNKISDYLHGESNCSVVSVNESNCKFSVGKFVINVNLKNDTVNKKIAYSIGTLTGTYDYVKTGEKISSLIINGQLYGMTQSTKATIENVAVTREFLANDMYRYKLTGKMTDKNSSGVAVLALEFANGTQLDAHEPVTGDRDMSKYAANLVGIFRSANYSFKGQFELSNLVEKEYTNPNCWTYWNGVSNQQVCHSDTDHDVVSGKAAFTGTISGVGLSGLDTNANNNFDMLEGKLALVMDGSNFNPAQSRSSTNYQTGTITFTGTTYLAATDPGLKLELSMSYTGYKMGTVSANYKDSKNGISITGSTNFDDNVSTPKTITLTDANAIKITFNEDSDSAVVSKGVTKLADIVGSMVNYTDGTTASLY